MFVGCYVLRARATCWPCAGPVPHIRWVEPTEGSARSGQVLRVGAVSAREGFALFVGGVPCNASAFESCDSLLLR